MLLALRAFVLGPFQPARYLPRMEARSALAVVFTALVIQSSSIMFVAVMSPARLVSEVETALSRRNPSGYSVEQVMWRRARAQSLTRIRELLTVVLALTAFWALVGWRLSKNRFDIIGGTFSVVVFASIPETWLFVIRAVWLAGSGVDMGTVTLATLLPTHAFGLEHLTISTLWWAHLASVGFALLWRRSGYLVPAIVWSATIGYQFLSPVVFHLLRR